MLFSSIPGLSPGAAQVGVEIISQAGGCGQERWRQGAWRLKSAGAVPVMSSRGVGREMEREVDVSR